MFTENTTQQVQWQDFIVKSEVDVVFEMARQKGWKDCEIFGYGDMITQPLESKGWKLIPYDLYEYSIPAEGVDRVLKTINAGVRIKGVIIADDQRKSAPPPAPARPGISKPSAIKGVIVAVDQRKSAPPPAPARPSISRPSEIKGVIVAVDQRKSTPPPAPTRPSSRSSAGTIFSFIGIVLLGLIVTPFAFALMPLWIIVNIFGQDYDPKLIVLVDDGKGNHVWISLLTWYE